MRGRESGVLEKSVVLLLFIFVTLYPKTYVYGMYKMYEFQREFSVNLTSLFYTNRIPVKYQIFDGLFFKRRLYVLSLKFVSESFSVL